ncbi:MAG TPA: AAA family ATPase [Gammaproteobacteria bacterium]|nr:AAA family ATPase [Gammaproteobacteria bacterium]
MTEENGIEQLYHLIEAIRKHTEFDHPVEKFELVETHISFILLTGHYAYKFKKPVNPGFLDFTTLEKRKFYCEEELRLNRRFAPDIYLDVTVSTGTPDHPVLDGDDDPLEYAVKMLQFPECAELDSVLEKGELTSGHMDDLARRIADFHQWTDMARKDSPFGTLESVRRSVLDNFSAIRDTLQLDDCKEQLEQQQSWTVQSLEQLAMFVSERKQEGYVRECHGDLHLGNIALFEGKPVPFDCIEFSEDFRFIDVMNEIAFLIMDLDARGQSPLSFRFLDSYLQLTGDYEGLRLLRFYCVYRALVRCKVTCIRLSQDDLGASERHRKSVLSRHYLELADHYTKAPAVALLITHGLSGSGKTTLTQPLLERVGAIRVRSDVERKRLHGLGVGEKSASGLKAGIYKKESTTETYDRLLSLSGDICESGYPVIVDATFLQKELRMKFRRFAKDRNIPFAVLDFQAGEEDLRERVRKRKKSGSDASEAGKDVLEYQIDHREPLDDTEIDRAVVIDTSAAIDEIPLTGILAKIRGLTGLAPRHIEPARDVD